MHRQDWLVWQFYQKYLNRTVVNQEVVVVVCACVCWGAGGSLSKGVGGLIMEGEGWERTYNWNVCFWKGGGGSCYTTTAKHPHWLFLLSSAAKFSEPPLAPAGDAEPETCSVDEVTSPLSAGALLELTLVLLSFSADSFAGSATRESLHYMSKVKSLLWIQVMQLRGDWPVFFTFFLFKVVMHFKFIIIIQKSE